jgi:MFS family permease
MIKKVLPVLCLCTFCSMVGSGIVAPLLPIYATNLGITGIWLGIIFGVFSLSRAFLSPVFGRLSDRKGRRVFICIGVAGYTALSVAYAYAETQEMLALVRLLQGAASAMIVPIAQSYVGDLTPKGEEARWMGYFNAAFAAGFGCGPLLGGIMTDHFGQQMAFFTMGALNLVALVVALSLLPRQENRRVTTGEQASFRTMSRSPITLGLWAMGFSNALGSGASQAFFPIIAHEIAGATPTQVGILLAIQILVSSVGNSFGRMGDRFNRRWLAVGGNAISLVYLVAIPFARDFSMLAILSVVTGIGSSIASWGTSALMVTEGRRFGMGASLATLTMLGGFGMWLGPMAGGIFVEHADTSSAFFFAAVAVAVACALFIWLAILRGRDRPAAGNPAGTT